MRIAHSLHAAAVVPSHIISSFQSIRTCCFQAFKLHNSDSESHSSKMASIMSGLRDMVAGGTASSGQPAKLQSTAACAGLGPEAEVQKRFFEQQSFRERRPETDEKGLSQAQASMRTKPDCGEEGYRGSGKMLGKIALITGGDSGIGRAIAIAYAREGADLCLVYDKNDVDANDVKLLVEAAGAPVPPREGRRQLPSQLRGGGPALCDRAGRPDDAGEQRGDPVRG